MYSPREIERHTPLIRVDTVGSRTVPDERERRVTRTANTSRPSESDHIVSGEQDNEIEAVVVLVSHGAGCNALIGALTQQPVLADIGMSSLTMAQRRVGFDSRNVCLTRQKSLSSLDTALHHMSRATMPEMYDLKLFANTDHLAAPSPPSRTPSLSRSNARSRFGSGFTSSLKEINFGSLYGSSSGSGRDHSANASLGSMRRSSGGSALVMAPSVYNANTGGVTVGGGMSSFSVTRPDRSGSGSVGLMDHEKTTKAKKSRETARKDENPASLIDAHKLASAVTPSGKEGKSPGRGLEQSSEHHDEEHDTFDEEAIPRLWAGTGNGGLWGTPRPPVRPSVCATSVRARDDGPSPNDKTTSIPA
ncbi:hypothetical protein NUW58_g9592 [Xylaria curta]|uniref:Uncharacterized protein n=1 Tax=Xylaria curta TaxID=42375 RepID=A0ACC1MUU9_9PEZI|nr:hypothetical protein NUW58_g9592 [Xylaria curta]